MSTILSTFLPLFLYLCHSHLEGCPLPLISNIATIIYVHCIALKTQFQYYFCFIIPNPHGSNFFFLLNLNSTSSLYSIALIHIILWIIAL